jgi:hypothetical protein
MAAVGSGTISGNKTYDSLPSMSPTDNGSGSGTSKSMCVARVCNIYFVPTVYPILADDTYGRLNITTGSNVEYNNTDAFKQGTMTKKIDKWCCD